MPGKGSSEDPFPPLTTLDIWLLPRLCPQWASRYNTQHIVILSPSGLEGLGGTGRDWTEHGLQGRAFDGNGRN